MSASFFRDRYKLSLDSWDLDSEGRMLELYRRKDGLFAILTIPPQGCATAVMVDQHHGRLSLPMYSEDGTDFPTHREIAPGRWEPIIRPLHRGHRA